MLREDHQGHFYRQLNHLVQLEEAETALALTVQHRHPVLRELVRVRGVQETKEKELQRVREERGRLEGELEGLSGGLVGLEEEIRGGLEVSMEQVAASWGSECAALEALLL